MTHSIHSTLSEYHPSSRHFRGQYRLTVSIGAVAVLINLFFVLLIPDTAGPLYWFFTGACLGGLLILLGGRGLESGRQRFSPLGTWLHARFESWFPLLQFWLRHIFVALVFAAVWLQLVDQGVPTRLGHQISLIVLFVYIPIRTLLREKALAKDTRRWDLINEASSVLMIAATAIFIGFTLNLFILPERETTRRAIPEGPLFSSIALWVFIVLIISGRMVLMLDRILRKRLKKKSAQSGMSGR